jgi:hypothetical protein
MSDGLKMIADRLDVPVLDEFHPRVDDLPCMFDELVEGQATALGEEGTVEFGVTGDRPPKRRGGRRRGKG